MYYRLISILMLVSGPLCAQDLKDKAAATPSSEADIFSAQAGTLIEKQFAEIGSVRGVQVKVLRLTDIISGKKVSSLRFEYAVKGNYTTDTKIAALDSDEIDGLIKSINTLESKVFTTQRDVYTEVTFQSRSGFQCGAYYEVEKNEWKPYLQIEKYGKSTVFITKIDLIQLLGLVEEAKKKM